MSIHLKELKHRDLGGATIIVGDPGRVSPLVEAFDERSIIVNNRESFLMDGYYKSQKVSVCSTSIGVGSAEICVSELLENGAKQIIRYGGCGAWCDDTEPDDIILNTGMARTTGLMMTCVPDTYPAVADSLLVSRIAKYLSGSKKIHIGLGPTAGTYYIGQGRGITIKGETLPVPNMIEEWPSLGIMNCKTETVVLYILASLYQIPTVNCLTVHVGRKNEEWEYEEDYHKLYYEMAQLILDAMLESSTQYEKEA